jgi:RHS repeat-associated protein
VPHDSSATQRRAGYVYDLGTDRPLAVITGATSVSKYRYLVQDMSRNVVAVSYDSTRSDTLSQEIVYDPRGIVSSISGTLGDTVRLRWKGLPYEGDSTQLYYARRRWYDPRTGRFMSEDPIQLAGGINVYVFAGSDPINFVDPLGLDATDADSTCNPFFNLNCSVTLQKRRVGGDEDPFTSNVSNNEAMNDLDRYFGIGGYNVDPGPAVAGPTGGSSRGGSGSNSGQAAAAPRAPAPAPPVCQGFAAGKGVCQDGSQLPAVGPLSYCESETTQNIWEGVLAGVGIAVFAPEDLVAAAIIGPAFGGYLVGASRCISHGNNP